MHRDLKPENAMVTRGRTRQDPGLRPGQADAVGTERAKSAFADDDRRRRPERPGTVGYMSPEQASGHARRPVGPVLARLDALRDGHGKRAFEREAADALGDHHQEPDLRKVTRSCRRTSAGSWSGAWPRNRRSATPPRETSLGIWRTLRDHLLGGLHAGRLAPARRVRGRSRNRGSILGRSAAPALVLAGFLTGIGWVSAARVLSRAFIQTSRSSRHAAASLTGARFAPDGQTDRLLGGMGRSAERGLRESR